MQRKMCHLSPLSLALTTKNKSSLYLLARQEEWNPLSWKILVLTASWYIYHNLCFVTLTTCKQTTLISIQKQCVFNVQSLARGNHNSGTVVGMAPTF